MSQRRAGKKAILAVDGGNLLFQQPRLAANREEQERRTAATIAAAYHRMGYAAVGVGRYDLAAGVDFLRHMTPELPWVSANIAPRDGGPPPFPGYRLVRAGDYTVGVMGITGQDAAPLLGAGYHLLPWQEVLPALVDEVGPRCQLLVLLSTATPQENLEIARRFSGIHLIVQASGSGANRPPTPVHNTLVVQTVHQGKYLGVLRAAWQPPYRWRDPDLAARRKNKQATLDRYRWQLDRWQREGDPEVRLRDDPQRLASYRRVKAIHDKLAAEVAALAAADQETGAGVPFQVEYVALETTLPDDPAILELQQRLKEEIRAINSSAKAAQAPRLTPTALGYLGPAACRACHDQVVTAWQATRHARAYDTLEAKGRQLDLDCLPCHVTAVFTGAEEYALALPESLLAVGCEACHGPGAGHAKDPATPLAQVTDLLCRRCHTPEQDDHFDFPTKKRLVHPVAREETTTGPASPPAATQP